MRSPIALRKFSIKISVFFTSEEYTSEPTIGQNGTFFGRIGKGDMEKGTFVFDTGEGGDWGRERET